MLKKIVSISGLVVLSVLLTGALTAAAVPAPTFTLVTELPATMNVGEEYTVVVRVDSPGIPFMSVHANPSFAYPGKGVVAVQGGDRATAGTSAVLEITYRAKSSTVAMTGGYAPVFFVVGVRYGGGVVVVQRYEFNVKVP
ncbi:MAG: hypothetical protein AB1607_11030 [Chloroflexota bacterium]